MWMSLINFYKIIVTSFNKNTRSTSKRHRLPSRTSTSKPQSNISTTSSASISTSPMIKWTTLYRRVCSRISMIMWQDSPKRNYNSIIKLQFSCWNSVSRTMRCLLSSTIKRIKRLKPRSIEINPVLLKNNKVGRLLKNKLLRISRKMKDRIMETKRRRKTNKLKMKTKVKI